MATLSKLKGMMPKTKKAKLSFFSIILILLIAAYAVYILIKGLNLIKTIEIALSPPKLPQYEWTDTQRINPNGYLGASSYKKGDDWFHFVSQGTETIPIPYDWFLALEAPKANPFWALLGPASPLFTEETVYRTGFIKTDVSPNNPDGLPIGFAKTPSIHFDGIDRTTTAIGFTCAACHTAQFTHENTRYIVDGGPATIDLGQFGKTLGAAIGQTALSAKFNLLDGRFDRFADRLLGDNNNLVTKNKLKEELSTLITSLQESSDTIEVTEGFTRNDALTRIGNQVFSTDFDHRGNYHAINAPVTYPHLWTTSWFDWVQYDGSIMQPLIRNSGEALGVKAVLDTTAPEDQRFASSINMNNLAAIEKWIGGTNPTLNGNKFNGLAAPEWPQDLPDINTDLAQQGEALYKTNCSGCHLPSVKSEEFWGERYWKPIEYYSAEGELQVTDERYLKLNIIPVDHVGTDPRQSKVLTERRVDTTGLGLNTQVCTVVEFESGGVTKKGLKYVDLKDSPNAYFGLSLGAIVDHTNERWFEQNYISPKTQNLMKGDGRPNCLLPGQGYKARPLNGVWATAPFLHNGSVATIYDLLTPANDRPKFVELGNTEFDPKKLGLVQSDKVLNLKAKKPPKLTKDYAPNGYFILDSRQEGNWNTGHSFEDGKGKGIIGRVLSEEEKWALIEYLKTQ